MKPHNHIFYDTYTGLAVEANEALARDVCQPALGRLIRSDKRAMIRPPQIGVVK